MLDAARDDVTLLREHLKCRADGGVVALGAACGENDLVRQGAEKRGDAGARLVHLLLHLSAEEVHGARVAVQLAEVGTHLLENALVHLGGGVVIKIDLSHPCTSCTVMSEETSSRSFCSTNFAV